VFCLSSRIPVRFLVWPRSNCASQSRFLLCAQERACPCAECFCRADHLLQAQHGLGSYARLDLATGLFVWRRLRIPRLTFNSQRPLPLKFSAPQLQQAIFLGLSSQEFAPVTALVLVSVLVFLQLGRAWFSTESRCGSVFSARS
jgi:hypothetical protein